MKNSKILFSLILILSLLFLTTGSILACQMKVERKSPADSTPDSGSDDVITVTYTQTHRNCTLPLKQTEFKAEGMKIVGATPWKEKKRGTFVRKFKVKYLQPGEATFNVIRNCSRGGADELLLVQVI